MSTGIKEIRTGDREADRRGGAISAEDRRIIRALIVFNAALGLFAAVMVSAAMLYFD